MRIKYLVLALVLLFPFSANAQTGSAKTITQLNTEINSQFPDNSTGAITPYIFRQLQLDLAASSWLGQVAGFAAPPPIGSTTPNTGAFSVLTMLGTGVTPLNSGAYNIASFANAQYLRTTTTGQAAQYISAFVPGNTGATGGYEKMGLYVDTQTNDPSGSGNRQMVGIDTRAAISTSNSTGIAWGLYSEGRILTGGDGLIYGAEVASVNNGTDQASIGTTTSKYGYHVVADGTASSTAAIWLDNTGSVKWHKGLYSAATSIGTSGGDTFIELATKFTVDANGITNATSYGLIGGAIAWSNTAPTVASGFCSTGSPVTALSASNGTAAFDILIGAATCGSTGTLTMPAATTGWVCKAADVTTPATHNIQQTGTQGSTTAVVLTDYSRTLGTAQNFNPGDHIHMMCAAY